MPEPHTPAGAKWVDIGLFRKLKLKELMSLEFRVEMTNALNLVNSSADSAAHLNQAVEYLRRSGDTDVLPLALLARGTDHDLDEVFRIPPPAEFRVGLSGRCEEPVGGW